MALPQFPQDRTPVKIPRDLPHELRNKILGFVIEDETIVVDVDEAAATCGVNTWNFTYSPALKLS